MEQKKLKELVFCDMYLSIDSEDARYRKDRTSIVNTLNFVPPEFRDDLHALRQTLAVSLQQDFSLEHDGVKYRVARLVDVRGTWYVLSRGVTSIPKLESLGFEPAVITQLQSLGRSTGLILIAGATGAGKTTTSSALIRDYLERYGDLAVTIEDPPELPLSGDYAEGKGHCFQISIEEDEWELALKAALRYRPRYLFVGELRMPGAAFQALRAAVSGHLVIATMHAGSVEQAIEGLVTLAAEDAGGIASTLVGDGIAAVLHQRLILQLQVTTLFAGSGLGDPVRNLIREKKFGALTTFIEQQAAQRAEAVRRANGK
jgi:twitching motility protein PilT